MDIVFNGSAEHLPDNASVYDLLVHAALHQRRVAVEVNGEIVPKSLHATHVLRDGDTVEIVHALGGG
ncbi:sulfur carrier protein ThiS [Lysobacter sp. HDW10]|uniref:sulfur carrier protein ThiS n=1 Tax=Lysobacter sp. HDW10 TaxID=2714936 RepID=UPI0014075C25|nr:sulfur carrier protein ThiS [Lysobacter sp. HDW10]QIK81109.1 sulfur carrier protein ThiS [Lysobacter sp. HDW10]